MCEVVGVLTIIGYLVCVVSHVMMSASRCLHYEYPFYHYDCTFQGVCEFSNYVCTFCIHMCEVVGVLTIYRLFGLCSQSCDDVSKQMSAL